jgi:hypothetical protein
MNAPSPSPSLPFTSSIIWFMSQYSWGTIRRQAKTAKMLALVAVQTSNSSPSFAISSIFYSLASRPFLLLFYIPPFWLGPIGANL